MRIVIDQDLEQQLALAAARQRGNGVNSVTRYINMVLRRSLHDGEAILEELSELAPCDFGSAAESTLDAYAMRARDLLNPTEV